MSTMMSLFLLYRTSLSFTDLHDTNVIPIAYTGWAKTPDHFLKVYDLYMMTYEGVQ